MFKIPQILQHIPTISGANSSATGGGFKSFSSLMNNIRTGEAASHDVISGNKTIDQAHTDMARMHVASTHFNGIVQSVSGLISGVFNISV